MADSEQFLRMAVFFAALQFARLKGVEEKVAWEVATDCALAPYEKVHRVARRLAYDLRSVGT